MILIIRPANLRPSCSRYINLQISIHTNTIQAFYEFCRIVLISLQDCLGHTNIRRVPDSLFNRDLMISTFIRIMIRHTGSLIHIYTISRINGITRLANAVFQSDHDRRNLECRTWFRFISYCMIHRFSIHAFSDTPHIGNGLYLSGLYFHNDRCS